MSDALLSPEYVTCTHRATWQIKSHTDVTAADRLGHTFASTLVCDRPVCMANGHAWVVAQTGYEPFVTKPIGGEHDYPSVWRNVVVQATGG